MFSGMMFCADCQSKMHYCTAKKFTHEQNWFTCALARENKGLCSGHFIREVYVEKAVLESLRRVFWYVQTYEGRFAKEMQDNSLAEKRKALAAKKRELEKTEKRIDELDTLFERTYEDNVSGKITNERFQKLSVKYEAEQAEKKTLADTLRQELQDETLEADGLETFIQMIKKVTMPEELTPCLLYTSYRFLTNRQCFRPRDTDEALSICRHKFYLLKLSHPAQRQAPHQWEHQYIHS